MTITLLLLPIILFIALAPVALYLLVWSMARCIMEMTDGEMGG